MSCRLLPTRCLSAVGVIILTGEGPLSFCSGGDQSVRGEGGYHDGSEDVPRLRVLDLHVQMRRCPKPIIAMVAGYAIGGGHILHMVADLTIAADNAVFGQTGPMVGRYVYVVHVSGLIKGKFDLVDHSGHAWLGSSRRTRVVN